VGLIPSPFINAALAALRNGEGINPTWSIERRRARRLVGGKMTATQIWIRLQVAQTGA